MTDMEAKPSVAKGAFNILRIIAGIVIQSLAALALDGWLSAALWAFTAWNVVVLVLVIFGLLQMSVEQRKRELRKRT